MRTDRDCAAAFGGLFVVRPDGSVVVAHNSPAMFAAFHGSDQVVALT
jgi:L-asparaginase / beta-aspartyl-peptidase